MRDMSHRDLCSGLGCLLSVYAAICATKFPSVQHDKLRPTSIFVRRSSCLELTARTFATNHINQTFQALSKYVFIRAQRIRDIPC